MAEAIGKKNDGINLFFKYFTEKSLRDLFRGINNILFANKHLIGKETQAIKKGCKHFTNGADIFNIADFFVNLNTIRNHLMKKEIVKDIPLLMSDTVNSVAESIAWLSTTGVISLSAYASSWVTSMSGITLMLSFSKRSIQNILELKKPHNNETKELKQRKITMFNLAKNISFFAIGVILFTSGWFGFALNIAAITICSTAAIISSFAAYYIENRKADDKKAENVIPLDPKRVDDVREDIPTESLAPTAS